MNASNNDYWVIRYLCFFHVVTNSLVAEIFARGNLWISCQYGGAAFKTSALQPTRKPYAIILAVCSLVFRKFHHKLIDPCFKFTDPWLFPSDRDFHFDCIYRARYASSTHHLAIRLVTHHGHPGGELPK